MAGFSQVDLSQYTLTGRFDLPEPTRTTPPTGSLLAQEASAVTYNKDTDTLFVVGDGGTSIVQVDKQGKLIDSMTLAKGSSPQGTEFYDPEGLAYAGNRKFVFVEERDRQVVEFTYAAGTTLTRAAAKTVKLGTSIGNIGLEGISYDPQTGGYLLAKEQLPEGVYQTDIDFAAGSATNGSATTENSTNLFDPALAKISDIADIFALSNVLSSGSDTDNLLLLSQEEGKIVNIDRTGVISSFLNLKSASGNPLPIAEQQPEGITVDKDGNIYIVAENGGGDFDHPQLWVYSPSSTANQAPTVLALANAVTTLAETANTSARTKIADLSITDDGIGSNEVSITGTDAASFEIIGEALYLKAGVNLDYETKNNYQVSLSLKDITLSGSPAAIANYSLAISDVVNEVAGAASLFISEVAPWSSGNSPILSDWFELSNTGSAAINISNWKVDDSSASFNLGGTLTGISSIAGGESVIFIEIQPSDDFANKKASFLTTWFGGNPPTGLQIGSYTAGGLGLSTGGDAVNIFNADGVLQASVSFGASPVGPYPSYNNAAGKNSAAISTPSLVGVNGAFKAVGDEKNVEIGSPGTVGKLFISEVAPWSSSSSPVKSDWFEVTNSTTKAIDISGWKVDDNSQSPAAAVALNGISSIAPGESVIFLETLNSGELEAKKASFLANWFSPNTPNKIQIGSYSGSGLGLSTGGDGVNLYDSNNLLKASVSFGLSPAATPFTTFENTKALDGVIITAASAEGVNGAIKAIGDTAANEIGSPGTTVSTFSLQLLSYYGESGMLGVTTAPILGALIDKFDDQYSNTLVIAEGDSFIPGPWLIGGSDPSLSALPSIGSTALGRPDIAIMNAFGTDVSALGNHEFDLGSPIFQASITPSGKWLGAQFPFITANLDFSADSSLKSIADTSLGGTANTAGLEASSIKAKIAPYAIVTQGGEKIGIVGATTYDLLQKTSPNGTKPKDDGDATTNDLQEVAVYIQAAVDALKNSGVNKVVLVDQLDTIERNKLLAPLVTGIDIMVAGGGHERLGDATDIAVGSNGHTADFIAADYPIIVSAKDGKNTLIVTTDTEYTYLSRLVVEFNQDGEILTDKLNTSINGAYASSQANLQAAYNTSQSAAEIVASSTIGSSVSAITTAINSIISSKDAVIFGYTSVYLEGDRAYGRAQEVNLGDLTADANLYVASKGLAAGTLLGSLKNGGGLRASIGTVDANGIKSKPGATDVKPAGAISQLEIENALRFDNKLIVFDTTPKGLLAILNYAAGLSAGNGGYAQIGGVRFSFDPSKPNGEKVQDIAIYDLGGKFIAKVADNGVIDANAPKSITLSTLNFTANGGDGYPIKANATNFRYLLADGSISNPIDSSLDFTAVANVPVNALGEQAALQSYLKDFYGTPDKAYGVADTIQAEDQRIQNLLVKPLDTVIEAPTYNFSAATFSSTEGVANGGLSNGTLRVTRSGDASQAGSVVLQLADGTAKGAAAAPAEGVSTGPSTTTTPYVQPVAGSGVAIKSLLTVGDSVGGYKLAGIPDGLGAFDNSDGTFTLLISQEIVNTLGAVRAHGGKGAFVSSWVINKSDLSVVSGADLIQNVFGWDATLQKSNTAANNAVSNPISFTRFCSSDLAAASAFYNAGSGLGSQARIFLNGEEGGSTGYALANVASGGSKGNTYVLGKFNPSTNGSGITAVGGWENLLANPFAQDKTVVIGNNDGGTGALTNALAVYVGTKTNSGSEADKAGLTNGALKFLSVTGNPLEITDTTSRATGITNGTRFSLSTSVSTTFSRPEDGAWDPNDASKYYFVTTDRLDQVSDGTGAQVGVTRLWRLSFDDITNPDAGGKIDLLVDGDTVNGKKVNMFDNITIDKYGHILLQEDVGNAAHNGKIWEYDLATDSLKLLTQNDPSRFGDLGLAATAPFTQDEETSGIIDLETILGAGWSLLVNQAHYTTGISADLVEGGQLLALFNPNTYKSAQPDFINTAQTVAFAPGETFKDVSLPVFGDTRLEGSETLNLSLTNPSAGSALGISQPTATFTIQDINPTPTNILLTKVNIDENVAAGSLVGNFSTEAPISGAGFSFTLVTGSGDTDNSAFTLVDNQLKLNATPNFETKSNYSIRVKTTQQGGQTFEKVFNIAVNDLPETASIDGTSTASVKEGTTVNPSGFLVTNGTLSVTDQDAGQAKFKTNVAAANGNLGSLSITESGAYTYTLSNALPAVQNLAPGQTKTDTFTVQSLDGSASKDIVVTINGAKAGFNAVAAGDPTCNRVTLWTRTYNTSDSSGRTGISEAVTVQVALDTSFAAPVFSADGLTSGADHDYTVKIDATGLQADTTYYYRYKTLAGELSSVGSFQTAPLPTSDVAVHIGHSGDIDGLMRPYPLVVDLAAQKFDAFIFNGDTIYETASSGSAATPSTKDAATGVVTQQALLDAYHRKYLENLLPGPGGTYPGLTDFFAAQANFTTYDNHELGNKAYINGGAPSTLYNSSANGSSATANDVNTTGQFINDTATFNTLQQAFLDYQPIRTPEVITAQTDLRSDGEQKLYGTQQYGQNAQVFNLDTRSFRDVRLNLAVGGDDTGARADNPDRTLLGATQKAWFKQALLDATAAGVTWKFINITDPIDMIGAYGTGEDGGKSWWGGYRAERNELLKFIADNNINNVVFLSSDDHQGRINELTYLPDASLDPTIAANYKVLDNVFSIVDGPLGATGPDTVTDHSFTNVKTLADALAAKQVAAGLNPIGLDKNFAGLFNVYREGDTTAASSPKAVDFYSPDTNNYVALDVTPEGVLTVTLRGINSYATNSFPEPSAANAARTILSFSIDGNPVISGTTGNDTNEPGFSTVRAFTGEAQTIATGSGNDLLDVALVSGYDNTIFTGSGADTVYASDHDVITGGTGGDTFWATAGDGNRLDGGKDNDTFYIETQRNRALGGAGDDRFFIQAGAGTNYLNGGAGRDQFWLISATGDLPSASQQVLDFHTGEDQIGLKGVSFGSLSFSQVGRDTLLSLGTQKLGLFSNTTAASLANPNNFIGLI